MLNTWWLKHRKAAAIMHVPFTCRASAHAVNPSESRCPLKTAELQCWLAVSQVLISYVSLQTYASSAPLLQALSMAALPSMQVIEMTQVTSASDIWSVGCLIIELLTGAPPYSELQPMSALFRIVADERPPLPEAISGFLHDFLARCFQKVCQGLRTEQLVV